MKVFQYVVFYVPQTRDDPTPAQIVAGPTCVLARTEKHVLLQLLRDLPEEWKRRIDGVEVAVRPF
jgi:hypothetical protein